MNKIDLSFEGWLQIKPYFLLKIFVVFEGFVDKHIDQLESTFFKNVNLLKNSFKKKILSFPDLNEIKSIFDSILSSR